MIRFVVKRYLVLKDHCLVSKALILIFWGSFGILIVHLCQVQIKFISICSRSNPDRGFLLENFMDEK